MSAALIRILFRFLATVIIAVFPWLTLDDKFHLSYLTWCLICFTGLLVAESGSFINTHLED